MSTLYILCGLPFSGKSLLSKIIEETTSIERVSFDDMMETFKKLSKDISYDAGRLKIERSLMKKLKAGISVVYDSTNLNAKHRNSLKELARECGALSEVVYLKVSAKEVQKRLVKSSIDKSHHFLTEKFVSESMKRLEEPTDCILISSEIEKSKFLKSLR